MSNKFYIKCDLFDKIEDLYRTGTNCITILPSEVIPESQALTVLFPQAMLPVSPIMRKAFPPVR